MKFQVVILSLVSILFFGCKSDAEKTEINEGSGTQENPNLVEESFYSNGELTVITEAMDFQTADTINSGWNKLIYENRSPEVHFIIMDKFPSDSIMEEDIKNDLLPPFEDAMAFLIENKPDSAFAEFGKIPTWFNDVKRFGGTGLISPQSTAESMIHLEPGKYMMECYVKMANGEWHTSHGMWKFITVTDETTSINEPNMADVTITVSSTEGYNLKNTPKSGNQRFRVDFIDQVPYEHFSGHDVNLVRYNEKANMDSLVAWLNWMRPTGLRTPTPDGFTFLGGMNNCEAGKSGFFDVELSPGNYVLISETPEADKKGLFKKFEVKSN